MSRFMIGAIITTGVLTGLCFSSVSQGEDLGIGIGLIGGPNFAAQLAKTRPGNFMSAIPGGTFVVTVAHIGPSPEDAIVRGRPATCDAVRFRLDALKLKTGDGSVEVELGERQELAPGESYRMVYPVEPRDGTNLPTYDLDQMGFRLRSEPASSRCSVVANGLFYADPATTAPIPFALIPSVSPAPHNHSPRGR